MSYYSKRYFIRFCVLYLVGISSFLFIAHDVNAATAPCTIQGYKQLNNYGARVTVSGNGTEISSDTNPYFIVVPGNKKYTVTLSGYSEGFVYSTYCANKIDCHSNTDASKVFGMQRTNVLCPAGGYADLWFTSRAPNCADLVGPETLTVGQVGDYTAKFYSYEGQLTGQIFVGNFDTIIKSQRLPSTSGIITGVWTPTEAGTYIIGCRAWNDGNAECRPASLVDRTPGNQFACGGSNGNGLGVTKTVVVTEALEEEPPPDESPPAAGNPLGATPPIASWTDEGTTPTFDDRIDFIEFVRTSCSDADRDSIYVYDSRATGTPKIGLIKNYAIARGESLNSRCYSGLWGSLPLAAYYRFYGTKAELRQSLPQFIKLRMEVGDASTWVMSNELDLGGVTVPPAPCTTRPQGDANCDGAVNTADFDIFKTFVREQRYTNIAYSADFNADSKVDLKDYEIWRNTVYP